MEETFTQMLQRFMEERKITRSGLYKDAGIDRKLIYKILKQKGNKKILFIDAQAAKEKKEHQNIILLLDTSGSVSSDDEVTQEAIAAIFSKLKVGDRISLVTYSTKDHTYFKGFEINYSFAQQG